MQNQDQKRKQFTNSLIVLQEAMQAFANPISKITFEALPRIYGKRKKKKYVIKNDFQPKEKSPKERVYPVHHCFQSYERLVNSPIAKQIQIQNFSSTKRYKTEIKKSNRLSTDKLSKPRNEACINFSCSKDYNHSQLIRSQSKQRSRMNYYKAKNIRLPEISKSPEPDDVESRHKVTGTKFQYDSQRKKRPLTLLDLLRNNQRDTGIIDRSGLGQDEGKYESNYQYSSIKRLAHNVSVQTQMDPSYDVPIQLHQEQNKEQQKKQQQKDKGKKDTKHLGQKQKLSQLQESNKKNKQQNQKHEEGNLNVSNNNSVAQEEDPLMRHENAQKRFAQLKQIYQQDNSSDSSRDDSRSISSSLSSSSISKYVFQKTKNPSTIFQALNKQERKSSSEQKPRVRSEKIQAKEETTESKKKKEKFVFQKKNGLFVIPEEDEYVDYIKDYEPVNNKLNMKNLIKNQSFQIVKSDDGVYFGEFKDQKKHGKGIMVTEKTIFEGKYNSDVKVQGCQRNIDGVYQGQFVNGVREGYGTFQWNNGQIFEGEWRNGTKNGYGVWKSPKGDFYEGEWKLNRQHGKGLFKHKLSTYRGYFVDFLKNGEGEQIFTNGDRYIGIYKEGKPHGPGKYIWADGSSFEGQFVKGVREGHGVWKYSNGTVYEGQFKNDFKHGKGREKYSTGQLFQGMFKGGEKFQGTLFDSRGNPIKITNQI